MGEQLNELQLIKEYIYENELVSTLLEKLGCDFVESRNNRVEAQLPEQFHSENKRSVQVYENENLSSRVRSRFVKGDIYTLTAFLLTGNNDENHLKKYLPKAKTKIIELLDLKQFKNTKSYNNNDPNEWLKKIKRKRRQFDPSKYKPNKIYPEETLDELVLMPYKEWLDEGISYKVQQEYKIGLHLNTERVCLHWRNKDGELIGSKGRYIGKNKDIARSKKYMFIINCNQSIELFNLDKALPHIQKHKKVVVFEGEKSVLKAESMGIHYTVAIGSSDISEFQAYLLKSLGLDVDIILAYDKDKSKKDILTIRKVLGKEKLVYGILDQKNLLGEKVTINERGEEIRNTNSPVDFGEEIFLELLNKYTFRVPFKEEVR